MIRADFQSRIWDWCVEVFGEDIALNKRIRNFRFFEEAAELVQSLGMTQEEAHKLVDYVYGRPVGVPHQEMGGTVVTLYALANANGIKVGDAGWDEFNRCCQPEVIEKIRAKQKNKPNPEDVLPAVVGEANTSAVDYDALVKSAWAIFRYAAGTGGCIAFKQGAEWQADQEALRRKVGAPGAEPAFHLNKNGDVAVADDYCYETDMSKCPKGAKVILLGAGGVATLGNYDGDEFWVGWAALPKVKK